MVWPCWSFFMQSRSIILVGVTDPSSGWRWFVPWSFCFSRIFWIYLNLSKFYVSNDVNLFKFECLNFVSFECSFPLHRFNLLQLLCYAVAVLCQAQLGVLMCNPNLHLTSGGPQPYTLLPSSILIFSITSLELASYSYPPTTVPCTAYSFLYSLPVVRSGVQCPSSS